MKVESTKFREISFPWLSTGWRGRVPPPKAEIINRTLSFWRIIDHSDSFGVNETDEQSSNRGNFLEGGKRRDEA